MLWFSKWMIEFFTIIWRGNVSCGNFVFKICHFWNFKKWSVSLNKQQEEMIVGSKHAQFQWVTNSVFVAMILQFNHTFLFNFLKWERFTLTFFSKCHDFIGFFKVFKMAILCDKLLEELILHRKHLKFNLEHHFWPF